MKSDGRAGTECLPCNRKIIGSIPVPSGDNVAALGKLLKLSTASSLTAPHGAETDVKRNFSFLALKE